MADVALLRTWLEQLTDDEVLVVGDAVPTLRLGRPGELQRSSRADRRRLAPRLRKHLRNSSDDQLAGHAGASLTTARTQLRIQGYTNEELTNPGPEALRRMLLALPDVVGQLALFGLLLGDASASPTAREHRGELLARLGLTPPPTDGPAPPGMGTTGTSQRPGALRRDPGLCEVDTSPAKWGLRLGAEAPEDAAAAAGSDWAAVLAAVERLEAESAGLAALLRADADAVEAGRAPADAAGSAARLTGFADGVDALLCAVRAAGPGVEAVESLAQARAAADEAERRADEAARRADERRQLLDGRAQVQQLLDNASPVLRAAYAETLAKIDAQLAGFDGEAAGLPVDRESLAPETVPHDPAPAAPEPVAPEQVAAEPVAAVPEPVPAEPRPVESAQPEPVAPGSTPGAVEPAVPEPQLVPESAAPGPVLPQSAPGPVLPQSAPEPVLPERGAGPVRSEREPVVREPVVREPVAGASEPVAAAVPERVRPEPVAAAPEAEAVAVASEPAPVAQEPDPGPEPRPAGPEPAAARVADARPPAEPALPADPRGTLDDLSDEERERLEFPWESGCPPLVAGLVEDGRLAEAYWVTAAAEEPPLRIEVLRFAQAAFAAPTAAAAGEVLMRLGVSAAADRESVLVEAAALLRCELMAGWGHHVPQLEAAGVVLADEWQQLVAIAADAVLRQCRIDGTTSRAAEDPETTRAELGRTARRLREELPNRSNTYQRATRVQQRLLLPNQPLGALLDLVIAWTDGECDVAELRAALEPLSGRSAADELIDQADEAIRSSSQKNAIIADARRALKRTVT